LSFIRLCNPFTVTLRSFLLALFFGPPGPSRKVELQGLFLLLAWIQVLLDRLVLQVATELTPKRREEKSGEVEGQLVGEGAALEGR
jgi:hypothetical protein